LVIFFLKRFLNCPPHLTSPNIMKFFMIIITALCIGVTANPKMQQRSSTSLQKYELQKMVDEEFLKYKEKVPEYPGGIILYAKSNKHTFLISSGMTLPVSKKIHFRAASNTKIFTAAAILQLHQEGKLNVYDPVTARIPGSDKSYLPDTKTYNLPYKKDITILDLLRHRAGIYDVTNERIPDSVDAPYRGEHYLEYILKKDPAHTFSFDELIGINAAAGLSYFKPGTDYHYSNTGYSILGKIIERVSGESYQSFIINHIIKPMRLRHTSLPTSGRDQMIPEPFLKGYEIIDHQIYDVTRSNVSGNVAEGNLITTPEDLAVFLHMLLRGKGPLSHQTVHSILMKYAPRYGNDTGGYACGLLYNPELGYEHSGAHEGFLSVMCYDPEKDLTIVTFTNTWNLNGGMGSMFDQISTLLEKIAYQTKKIMAP